ncbi:MAG: HPr family phosphocarrier protein [Candidatus Accumulibacter sp.]|jgi:phosphocarrier protein HPr|uniref:HPr family phosphocarrier protein n=1 Tax=Candidatus Accumulibacter TaxID=327159 RepID=UPI00208CB4B4|nr:HPr family phosphocarrier protein [Accumulibacter sp.]MBK8116733.1 HPr family phosphocarrier protein [Accumulibacter sp.]MBK8385390.1 HPr family phosphocarrier protein [Accumulibacter sp.]MBK8576973.1 HPr family phosphocarrier protein [Candidatus Accumulibacter propinquus]
MVRAETAILNKLGLHARASAKLTQLASHFASDVWMEKGSRRINAKSIMGVMMLAAGKGSTVIVETDGADEQAASEAILELIAGRFGEAE